MKKKFLPVILLMLVIFTFILSTNVFAVDNNYFYTFNYDNDIFYANISIPENLQKYKYIYVFSAPYSGSNADYDVIVYLTDYKLVIKKFLNDNENGFFNFEDGGTHTLHWFRSTFKMSNLENNTLNFTNFLSMTTDKIETSSITMINNSITPMNSNTDLFDDTGSVVFQVAPQVEEQVTILPTITTSMDFSQVLMEILRLLPIVLITLIGLLGLRKAINLLLQLVRQV